MRGSPKTQTQPDGELFFVRKITQAKVATNGTRRNVKKFWLYLTVWDGYDDLTWEPVESFQGSKYAVRFFWEHADCGNRNHEQISRFKVDEIIQLKPSAKGTVSRRKPGPGRSSVGLILGTRVFALWTEDKHYYSGIVQKRSGKNPNAYVVRFDDDESEVTVSLKHMRLCSQLRRGDTTILKTDSVVVSDLRSDGGFMVKKLVDHTAVKISAHDIEEEWEDRQLTHADILCELDN
ncbi:hypothetical protein B0H19DRAFT_1121146 [Mycena capillaripes]|nr:hypothetical protein B0H19DRAFT_1121146 [Mycena capillaripes]